MTWIATAILSLTGTTVLILVFGLPALEASTPLGMVVPGELALVLGGVLASLGRLPLWAVVVAGDTVGYAVGRRFGERVLRRLPRRFVRPDRVGRATALVRRLGGPAVFVGRFTAVLRALVPVVAGTAGIPYRSFAVYNATGGIVWATGVALLGYGAGGAYQAAASRATWAGLILFGVGVLGVTAAALVRRALRGRPHHGETVR